jgi:hypothetical protein
MKDLEDMTLGELYAELRVSYGWRVKRIESLIRALTK